MANKLDLHLAQQALAQSTLDLPDPLAVAKAITTGFEASGEDPKTFDAYNKAVREIRTKFLLLRGPVKVAAPATAKPPAKK